MKREIYLYLPFSVWSRWKIVLHWRRMRIKYFTITFLKKVVTKWTYVAKWWVFIGCRYKTNLEFKVYTNLASHSKLWVSVKIISAFYKLANHPENVFANPQSTCYICPNFNVLCCYFWKTHVFHTISSTRHVWTLECKRDIYRKLRSVREGSGAKKNKLILFVNRAYNIGMILIFIWTMHSTFL
jgi:hypothetical protein